MKTKSKRVEKEEDLDGEIVIKKPKLSSLGRRKKRGDRLGTVELSNEDGFTTDEEEDEIEGQYEGYNVSNNKEQEKLEETDIGNVRKRGRPGKIKVEKVEQNENLSNRGIETKIKERKRKSQETDPLIDTRKKKEKSNVEDDKIDLHLSISEGKTEKLNVDVEGKESDKSLEGKKKKAERRIKKVASVEVIKTENISENEKQQESLEEEILNVRKRGRPGKIKVEKIDGNENLSSSGTETKVKEGKGKAEKTNQEADSIIYPPKKGENKNIDDDKMDLPLSISGGKTVQIGVDVEEKESNKSIQENKKKAEERKKKVASDEVIQTENISDDVKQPESQETEIVNAKKRGRPSKIKVDKVEENEKLSSQGTETKGENKNIDDDKMDLPLFSISVGKTVKLGVDVEEKESNKSIQENKKKAEERKKKVASDEVIQTENISDDVKQPESQETEIVNMRKRGRPTKIKVEKVEQNENVSSLGTEIKVKERKRKGEKSNQEPIIETRKEEENTNVDDKINLPLSISVGKTEKFKVEVDKKEAKKSFKGKGKKGEECMKKNAADDLIKTENISDDMNQLKSLAKEIVNARKRGRPSRIKVEKVEENKNVSTSSLGTETKIKERKIKGEKTIKETDTDTRKKEKNINIDDKIGLHHSISDGKTEKSDVDVEGKESNERFEREKKADYTDNRENDKSANLKEKEKKTEEFCEHAEVVFDKRKLDPNQEKFVGAHVSIAGGIHKSVLEAVAMKSFAFGLFLKSQRQWACKPLEDEAAEKFRKTCQEYGFLPQYIVPHGSYLMNLGSPDEKTLHKSRDLLIDDLQRCEKLGLTIFNFHPGSTCGKISVEKCLDNIAASIDIAHSKTSGIITVLENMSCQGHTIGGKFEELRGIINRVKDKSRMGVCLDTCHAFAAGFDLSTEEGFNQMLSDFESIVGFQYLKALHINDSKGKLGCHLDRHENIGKGHIGKAGFNRIMNCPKFNHIPMILETPCADNDSYAKEVEMLYTMCNT
ncbi:APEX1 [Mytilus edulis]|uniref:APEX1 n=1 Tax=Mytilus edulis TaxID=6550 RepID=A0A8S3SIB0_MYTED|nr:APEX1 [Mytilus edulis]